ncbi:MAG: DUF3362 domain-containing protein, partial [bacterium]|nr:DUF3362 domain-containing protein [bacterium]
MPEQVQDFYPTPSTLSTCMYYTEINPETMEKVYVPKSPHEKAMQRALIQYRNPKNYDLIIEALVAAGREDLIGFDKHCLVRPAYKDKDRFGTKRNPKTSARTAQGGNSKSGNSKSQRNGKTSDQGRGRKGKSDQNSKYEKSGFGPRATKDQGGKKKKAIRNTHKAKKA